VINKLQSDEGFIKECRLRVGKAFERLMALKVKDALVITISVSYKAKVQDGCISQYSVWRRASQKVLNSVQDQRFSACAPTSAWASLCNSTVEQLLGVKADEA